MNIILDPNIFELADTQTSDEDVATHFNYLSELLGFLKNKCINHRVIASEAEYCILCNFEEHPWNQHTGDLTRRAALSFICRGYTQLIKYCSKCVTPSKVIEVTVLNDINECSKNDGTMFNEFLRHLYCVRGSNEHIIFMGTANHKITEPLRVQIEDRIYNFYTILDINDDNVRYFSDGYRQILIGKLQTPTLNNPLPNSDLCIDYLKIQERYIDEGNDRKSVYLKVATEVALRNGYVKDTTLTKINSTSDKIRDIFKHSHAKIYLSIDVEKGAIEVFNRNGQHQGEYSYVGVQLQKADTSGKHDIRIKI